MVDEGRVNVDVVVQKKRKQLFMESHCFSLVVVFLYDRIAMLLREMLTLSILAERFILARKTSAANLSSQTRDMASNCINSINDYGDNVGSG